MTSDADDGGELQYDESVVGREVEAGTYEITPERIEAYCESLGETNELYTDEEAAKAGPYGGIIAPPGILFTGSFGGAPDPKVVFGNTQFMAGQRFEHSQTIRPGDTITAHAQVKEVFEKTGRSGRMVFVVRRTRYTNQDGVEVAANEQSQVYRQVAPRTD
jgi:acyl dehydratase